MEQIHKDCIRKNLVMLCERLTPEPLHTHLLADGVFNEVSMQYIKVRDYYVSVTILNVYSLQPVVRYIVIYYVYIPIGTSSTV